MRTEYRYGPNGERVEVRSQQTSGYREKPLEPNELAASATRLALRTDDRLRSTEQHFGDRLTALEQRGRATGSDNPWNSFGEFMIAVRRAADGHTDKRLTESRAAGLNVSGAPDEGGFLLPTDYSAVLADMVRYSAPIASRCMRLKAKRRSIALPAIDETSRAEGSRWGGVQSYWANEGDTVTAKKPRFRRLELNLNKLMALVYPTDELMEDADALGTFVGNAFAAEGAHVLDDMVFGGSGVGQPLGMINSPGLITVAKQAGQVASSVVAANITDMFGRILPECLPNAVWLVSPELFATLYTVYIPAGTGSVSTPMITPADADAPFGRLLSRPLLPVEQASVIGAVGDIVLADLSYYVVYEKPIDIALSMEVRYLNGEGVYRFSYRVDGSPIVKSPITPKNGGPTKSSHVTLAAR
jgi:HK97 family phage major capsid protein